SSRNGYLTPAQKIQAAGLYQQLQRVRQALLDGRRDYAAICAESVAWLTDAGWQVDYVEIRSPSALTAPTAMARDWVVLAAARLGNTRLIDNCEVHL
ncbi:MAG TPA: pantoate--beta-alanine ligase, partial [Methylophilus sp.]